MLGGSLVSNSKVFVVVDDGMATVLQDTLPPNVQVEIIDLDLIRMGESFPSPEAFKYCSDHNLFIERRKRPEVRLNGKRDEDPVPVNH